MEGLPQKPSESEKVGDSMAYDLTKSRRLQEGSADAVRINTPPLPLATETAQGASSGRRLLRAPTGDPNRRFPGLHSPSGGGAAPSLLLRKRLTYPFFALLALLGVGLLALLPGGPLFAQDSLDHRVRGERGLAAVATFTAVDPGVSGSDCYLVVVGI